MISLKGSDKIGQDHIEMERQRRCMYFIPQHKRDHAGTKICDHAVMRFAQRFPNMHGNIRTMLKSILENGEVVMSDGPGNKIIERDGVFCIITGNELKTVWTQPIFESRKWKVPEHWHKE